MSKDPAKQDILKVAKLAALHLSESEAIEFQKIFEKTLSHFAKLQEVDVSGLAPLLNPLEERRDWRPDHQVELVHTDRLLSDGPDVVDHQYRVPPVVG